ncbi:MAG: F0F1 ATP synthase subunit A [Gemmataceae bacterium]
MMDTPNDSVEAMKPHFNPFEHGGNADAFHLFETGPFRHVHLPEVFGYQISKFHVLLAVASLVTAVSFVWLGQKMKSGATPRGILWNLLESILFFVRDNIARPAIGDHDGDKFVPFLTTTFFFILINNLMGMIPFLGSATASVAVTAALALVSFVVTHGAGIKENGFQGYMKSYIPHISLDGMPKWSQIGMKFTLIPLIFILEVLTPFIRLFVLAVRLFANLLAGHAALFVLLLFIKMVSHPEWLNYNKLSPNLYFLVAPLSVIMVTLMSLLELMVAGLQAFIFTLLTAIFIGLAKHPAH